MLSILIPTYNYNVFKLVNELVYQSNNCKIEYEIIVLDDFSQKFHKENNKINDFHFCKFEVLEKNIGRSAIRNLLAKKAKFENLLFLDSDTIPIENNFISNYLNEIKIDSQIIYGGIKYQKEKPQKSKVFRWKYGTFREAVAADIRTKNPHERLLTLNFLIKKSVFDIVSFNEKIPNLRHEDSLFSYNLKQHDIRVAHFENPVYHLGLDDFDVAMKKENNSLIALKFLIENKYIPQDYIKLSKVFYQLKNLKLLIAIKIFYKITKPIMLKNLSSKNPILFIFDIYRLGFLSDLYLENKNNIQSVKK